MSPGGYQSLATILLTLGCLLGACARASEEESLGDYIEYCLGQKPPAAVAVAVLPEVGDSPAPTRTKAARLPTSKDLEPALVGMEGTVADQAREAYAFARKIMKLGEVEAVLFAKQSLGWTPGELSNVRMFAQNAKQSWGLGRPVAVELAARARLRTPEEFAKLRASYQFLKSDLLLGSSAAYKVLLQIMDWPANKIELFEELASWAKDNFGIWVLEKAPPFAMDAASWSPERIERFKETYRWARLPQGMELSHNDAMSFELETSKWTAQRLTQFKNAYGFIRAQGGRAGSHKNARRYAEALKDLPPERLERSKKSYLQTKAKYRNLNPLEWELDYL